MGILQGISSEKVSLSSLFSDEKIATILAITNNSLEAAEDSFNAVYNDDFPINERVGGGKNAHATGVERHCYLCFEHPIDPDFLKQMKWGNSVRFGALQLT